jgi:hypothetical protein
LLNFSYTHARKANLEREAKVKFLQKNWLIAGVLIVLALLGGSYVLNQNKTGETKKTQTTTTQEKKTVVTLDINDGVNAKHYDLASGVGKTALEVTQTATGDVKTSGTGTNAFVTSVNGREASNDKKEFWELDINGKPSDVGAGSYTVKDGDALVWKIATY